MRAAPTPIPSRPNRSAFSCPLTDPRYAFKLGGTDRDGDRTILTIEFASVDRRSNPRLIEDPGGHDDCFDWSGHVAARGRVWVDAATYDVVRVERGLRGPVDIDVPERIQRRYQLSGWVTLVRDDVTIRYKTVAFEDPDETLLLPESIDSLTMIRGGLQSTRRTQTFSDYRRFVTAGRVLE